MISQYYFFYFFCVLWQCVSLITFFKGMYELFLRVIIEYHIFLFICLCFGFILFVVKYSGLYREGRRFVVYALLFLYVFITIFWGLQISVTQSFVSISNYAYVALILFIG